MEDQMASDIKRVVSDRDVIEETINEARQSKIRGDNIQPKIADLLDNHDSLYRICQYEYGQRFEDDSESIVPVSNELQKTEYIDKAIKDEFVGMWEDINWIVPAVSVPMKNLGQHEKHWSETLIQPKQNKPDILEYTLRWGVDERIDAEIPGSRVLMRCVAEIGEVTGYFNYWRNESTIDDDAVSYLAEQYDIEWTRDTLRDILEDLEKIDTQTDGPPSGANPDIEVIWDNSTGGENVVGKMQVTPQGEQVTDAGEDGSDSPPRGFQ